MSGLDELQPGLEIKKCIRTDLPGMEPHEGQDRRVLWGCARLAGGNKDKLIMALIEFARSTPSPTEHALLAGYFRARLTAMESHLAVVDWIGPFSENFTVGASGREQHIKPGVSFLIRGSSVDNQGYVVGLTFTQGADSLLDVVCAAAAKIPKRHPVYAGTFSKGRTAWCLGSPTDQEEAKRLVMAVHWVSNGDQLHREISKATKPPA